MTIRFCGVACFSLALVLTPCAIDHAAADPPSKQQPDGEVEIESSVGSALQWLANHQSADGSWSFDHRGGKCDGRCGNPGSLTAGKNAATAMALLPFLGAGETHKKGDHKKTVRRGVRFLIANAKKENTTTSFLESGGHMYSHGLCATALCEAYGISGDKKLRKIAQSSLNFIVEAQDPVGGGWRYQPRQPGDTSVSGWQISALRAGQSANLDVPKKTLLGVTQFLNAVQSDGGARYGYTSPGAGAATTSIGLLSRLHFGWKRDNEAVERGVQFLQSQGPSHRNMYYNYYASQVMFQVGGEPWQKWNEKMRAFLVEEQEQDGHEAGSWYVAGDHGANRAGRLYCTSMAALTLEMYYRHLAIFQLPANTEQQGEQ
jgi:hypothetical protein